MERHTGGDPLLTTFADDESLFPAPAAGARGCLTKDAGGPVAPPAPPDGLTARETEVLLLIAEGLSNPQIARRLHVSTATVKTHINNLFTETGLKDRAEAVRYAYRTGLVRPPAG